MRYIGIEIKMELYYKVGSSMILQWGEMKGFLQEEIMRVRGNRSLAILCAAVTYSSMSYVSYMEPRCHWLKKEYEDQSWQVFSAV